MPAANAWSQGRVGPGAQFLDPKTLQRIGSLELVARGVVEGFLQGLHRSPFLGQSMDFAEYRPYVVGDDPRRIDWKVFARTERYYVKEYEAETNTNFTVLLDCSHSMAFGEGEFTKFDYARYLAACLSFLARKQGDRVGILTFDSKVREIVPCSARHLELVLITINRADAGRRGDFASALHDVTSRRTRKGLVALVSDLYLEPERFRGPLNRLREVGNDVMVFHVLDPAERDLPYEGKFTLEDMETEEFLPVTPEDLKADYRELMAAHIAEVRRVLVGTGADHILVDTGEPLDHTLFHYLLSRQERARRGQWASLS